MISNKKLLKNLYSDINGFDIDEKEIIIFNKTGGSSVYGEITYVGVKELIKHMGLTNKDIFYDLGSGTGSMVFQIGLETAVKKSNGIELSKTRHSHALSTYNKISRDYSDYDISNVYLKKGDILNKKYNDATVVFTDSVMFSEHFMTELSTKLSNIPKLRMILSCKLFDNIPNGFEYVKTINVNCTWMKEKTSVNIYERI
jgi:precorrin-6B methylase 2